MKTNLTDNSDLDSRELKNFVSHSAFHMQSIQEPFAKDFLAKKPCSSLTFAFAEDGPIAFFLTYV